MHEVVVASTLRPENPAVAFEHHEQLPHLDRHPDSNPTGADDV
jgi:hypothetical protein